MRATTEDLKGATIECMGIEVTIEKVYYAYKEREGWDIEFIDSEGHYRHWKQWTTAEGSRSH